MSPRAKRLRQSLVSVAALGFTLGAGCATGDSTGEPGSWSGYDTGSAASGASGGEALHSASGSTASESGGARESVLSTGATSAGGPGTAAPADSATVAPIDSGTAGETGAVPGSSGAASAEANDNPLGDGGPNCASQLLNPISAIASSIEPTDGSPTFVATNAIDNNFSTRWESLFQVDPSWIEVDFGVPVYFSEIDILWQSACASAYDVDVSSDATTWTTLKSLTTNPVVWQEAPTAWMNDDVEKISAVGRYVRVHGTKRAQSQEGYSIWEMRAFGANAACAP
jgi:hypothetical protein